MHRVIIPASFLVMLRQLRDLCHATKALDLLVFPANISLLIRGIHWKHTGGPRIVRTRSGEDNRSAKLDEFSVKEIRRLYGLGCYSLKQIGERFLINLGTIWSVVRHKTWRHLT